MMVKKMWSKLLLSWSLRKELGKKLPGGQRGMRGIDRIIILSPILYERENREGTGAKISTMVSSSLRRYGRRLGLLGVDWDRCYHSTKTNSRDKVWHYYFHDPLAKLEGDICSQLLMIIIWMWWILYGFIFLKTFLE